MPLSDHRPDILECGHLSTQFGRDKDGKRHCYSCCAYMDKGDMIEHGNTTLYLTHKAPASSTCTSAGCGTAAHWRVSNWPGSLGFEVTGIKHGKSAGFGGWMPRVDAWFRGPDSFWWHARNQGRSEIARCVRTKERF